MNQLLPDNEKHFTKFYLNNTAITELEENTFYDITFDKIVIHNSTKLKLINTHAFMVTNSLLKSFDSRLTPIVYSPPNYDIFYSLSLMLNIEEIIIINPNIVEVPSYAFRPIVGHQNKLRSIYIESGVIEKIGNYLFYGLNYLTNLSFYANKLDFIPKNAFHFEKTSDETMHLWLGYNSLNDSSFENGSFENFRKPTNLTLTHNNITYLDENIFLPFLQSNINNSITFKSDDKLNCDDCRNYWLRKEFHLFGNRTNISKCINGKSFLSNDNFANCK
jgi:hypothetical protein